MDYFGCIHLEGLILDFYFCFDLYQLIVLLSRSTGTRFLHLVLYYLILGLSYLQPAQRLLLSLCKNITLFSLDYIDGYSVAAAMKCAVETNHFYLNQVSYFSLSLQCCLVCKSIYILCFVPFNNTIQHCSRQFFKFQPQCCYIAE